MTRREALVSGTTLAITRLSAQAGISGRSGRSRRSRGGPRPRHTPKAHPPILSTSYRAIWVGRMSATTVPTSRRQTLTSWRPKARGWSSSMRPHVHIGDITWPVAGSKTRVGTDEVVIEGAKRATSLLASLACRHVVRSRSRFEKLPVQPRRFISSNRSRPRKTPSLQRCDRYSCK